LRVQGEAALEHAFEAGAGYLKVRLGGRYSLPDLRGIIEAIGSEAERGGHARALLDLTAVDGDQPDLDRFETGVYAAEQLAKLERVAVLMAGRARVNRFFEDVARNRGLQVRVTQDPGEALDWLTSP
jgi:hypothetical protein